MLPFLCAALGGALVVAGLLVPLNTLGTLVGYTLSPALMATRLPSRVILALSAVASGALLFVRARVADFALDDPWVRVPPRDVVRRDVPVAAVFLALSALGLELARSGGRSQDRSLDLAGVRGDPRHVRGHRHPPALAARLRPAGLDGLIRRRGHDARHRGLSSGTTR